MKKNDSRNKIGIFGSVPLFAIPLTTHNELKALVAISSFQGADEFAFPSMEKLAARSDLSLSALSKAVTGLVKKELVSRKKRYGHSNIYFLLYKTESVEEIKAENKKVAAMRRARNKRKNSDALNQLDNRIEQDKHALNQLDYDALNKQDDILKEQNKRTELKEQSSFPSQDKVTLFFEHHKKQLMQTRKHGDPDLHLVDKLGTLIEWDIETYDKILKAKQNSTWEVRRNQPNTAKWLLATMENENLETAKSNVVTFPKYDLEELRKEGFV